jgi:hypothetical protein
MTALLTIAWLVCTFLSLVCVYQFVGMHLMVCYFPEGKSWWNVPAQWLSLAAFAACAIYNPWRF